MSKGIDIQKANATGSHLLPFAFGSLRTPLYTLPACCGSQQRPYNAGPFDPGGQAGILHTALVAEHWHLRLTCRQDHVAASCAGTIQSLHTQIRVNQDSQIQDNHLIRAPRTEAEHDTGHNDQALHTATLAASAANATPCLHFST